MVRRADRSNMIFTEMDVVIGTSFVGGLPVLWYASFVPIIKGARTATIDDLASRLREGRRRSNRKGFVNREKW